MPCIPIIDLFAGPGGLGEGFSSQINGALPFRIALSVEKDPYAHKTLSLRAFYRGFKYKGVNAPDEYYLYLADKIERQVLEDAYPAEWEKAFEETLCAELGNPVCQPFIDERIKNSLRGQKEWLLIGGPPCQAYSLAGRSRMSNADDYIRIRGYGFEEDHRHVLYQQYLRVIAMYSPSVFVMENVKGILSAKLNGEKIFPKIIKDLKDPYKAGMEYGWEHIKGDKYHIVSFVCGNEPSESSEYLIRSENYSIPQTRHRVILLGIREDLWKIIGGLTGSLKIQKSVSIRDVIGELPKLRSGFSRGGDDCEKWKTYFSKILGKEWPKNLPDEIRKGVINACRALSENDLRRQHKDLCPLKPAKYRDWYSDENLIFLPNHDTRSHMDLDLDRYLFVSVYGESKKTSPCLKSFPKALLPKHKNVEEGINSGKFADRFKVQLWDNPASTITSHISKDGHYFIHPDPTQCRSLTVREAARLQTFPDNYFFEGGRTQQYHQVGNAVPPLLAKQLAEIVWNVFKRTNI